MQAYLRYLTPLVEAIASIPTDIPAMLLIAPLLLFLRIPVLSDILIIPYRLLLWLAHGLGLFQKKHSWSVVYDSKTKRPLDPAYVTVRNTQGVEVASMITDINGRFSLILPRGIYTIDVQKTNYAFPSYELRNAKSDGSYGNLYYGQQIDVVDTEQPVTYSIPMDQMGDDWNEQEKKRMNVGAHYGKQAAITISSYIYLALGVLASSVHYVTYLDMFSMNVSFAYFALILIRVFWYLIEPSHYGYSIVTDKHTGKPLAFAKVVIFSAVTKNQVLSKTTSFEGQFTALLPKGDYYATISSRDEAGNYTLLHTTSSFHLAQGYLDRKFSV